jgi:hypothetical protein
VRACETKFREPRAGEVPVYPSSGSVGEAPPCAVVATGSVSVDADYDNGGRGVPCRSLRGPNGAGCSALVYEARGEAEVDGSLPPSSTPTQTGTTASVAFRALVGPDGDVEVAVAPVP